MKELLACHCPWFKVVKDTKEIDVCDGVNFVVPEKVFHSDVEFPEANFNEVGLLAKLLEVEAYEDFSVSSCMKNPAGDWINPPIRGVIWKLKMILL